MTTGAQMDKYERFLDQRDDGGLAQKSRATADPGDQPEQYGGDDLNDSLNRINREDAEGYGFGKF